MKLTLQIFGKDLRHYWPEGAACIALLVTFGWNEVRGWEKWTLYGSGFTSGVGTLFTLPVLLSFSVVLLPVAWAFLVVRVIQAESLVGDRQFWITRPYEWEKLLAAKILFVLVFLNLPWLIADMVLLVKAGFSPTHYVGGLLWMQVLMGIALLLPITALATVTRSVTQLLLTLLGLVLFLIGTAWVSSQVPSSGFSGPPDYLVGGLFIGTCVAIVLLQYARRRTEVSRILIGAAGLAFLLILVATPYRSIVAHEFPPIGRQESPFQMTLLPAETPEPEPAFENRKEVLIRLPMSVAGVAPDAIVVINAFMVDLESPHQFSWNSGWTSHGLDIFPETKNARIDFLVKKRVSEQMESSPVKMKLSLAFTLFRDANRRSLLLPSGEFSLQDVGRCLAGTRYARSIRCFMPLRSPRSLMITGDMSESTCPLYEGESRASPGEIGRYWTPNTDSEPADFGISPVERLEFSFAFRPPTKRRVGAGLCPGTPVILSNPQPVRRNQMVIQVDNLRLPDYRVAPPKGFTAGYGIDITH